MLSDQNAGSGGKARVWDLPLQVFTEPDVQESEGNIQERKTRDKTLTESSAEQEDLEGAQENAGQSHMENRLEEARKEATAIEREAREKAEQILQEAQARGYEEGKQKGYEDGLLQAEQEIERKHQKNEQYFRDSLKNALEQINEEKEQCLKQYLGELKDIALAVAEKVIRISLKSSGAVISRMIEAETEKLRKMDWVKVYMEKEDYEAMIRTDGQLADKLSRLSDNVKFIVMEDGKQGTCIIEMPNEIIDLSVDTQMENIHRLVDSTST